MLGIMHIKLKGESDSILWNSSSIKTKIRTHPIRQSMLKQSQINEIQDISESAKRSSSLVLKKKFTPNALRLYITIALTYKSQDAVQGLLFVSYLGSIRHDQERISCRALHPHNFFRQNTGFQDCLDGTNHFFAEETRKISDEIWKEKTKHFGSGHLLLSIPDVGIKKLSKKDHDRVAFYISAFQLISSNNFAALFVLIAAQFPLIFGMLAIDDVKLQTVLNGCSRRELLMISSFVDAWTLRNDRWARLKLSSALKTRIAQRVLDIKAILAPLAGSRSSSIIINSFRSMLDLAASYPYGIGLLHALRLIILDEFLDKLPMSKQVGGSRISFKSVGLLVVLFFSFVFGLLISLFSLPIFIIKDSFTYFGKRASLNDNADADKYNDDGLNYVYLSMLDRLSKIFKWLPDNLLAAARHDPVKFNVDLKLDKKALEK